jgi:hypothetical protein
VIAMLAYVRDIMTTGVVTADRFFTDPARFTVTVHNGIVTLEGEPGSAVLGAGIARQVEHLEGVVAVRDRFVYPARSAPSFPSDPGLSPGRHGPERPSRRRITAATMTAGERPPG